MMIEQKRRDSQRNDPTALEGLPGNLKSEPENTGIVEYKKHSECEKAFRESFRETPLFLTGTFRDCGVLSCSKTYDFLKTHGVT